jgi:DNA-binding transcriptional MerR regulator
VEPLEVLREQRRWQIGELAKAGGVAVRVLRFYDDSGLAPPGSRVT